MTKNRIIWFSGGLVVMAIVILCAMSEGRSGRIDLDPNQLAQAVNGFWKDSVACGRALPPVVAVKELMASGYLKPEAVRSARARDASIRLWLDVEKPGLVFMKAFESGEPRLVRQVSGESIRIGFTGYTNSWCILHAGFVVTNVSRREISLREYQITPGPYRQQIWPGSLSPGGVQQVLVRVPVSNEPWQVAIEYQQEISLFSPESVRRLKFGIFKTWKENWGNTNRHQYMIGQRVTYVAGSGQLPPRLSGQLPFRPDQRTENSRFAEETNRIPTTNHLATGPRTRLADQFETP